MAEEKRIRQMRGKEELNKMDLWKRRSNTRHKKCDKRKTKGERVKEQKTV